MEQTSVALSAVIRELGLSEIYLPGDPKDVRIFSADVNRPGLVLAGYLSHFNRERIQIIGNSEHGFLDNLSPMLRHQRLDAMLALIPPAVIVARDLPIFPELRELCEKHKVPLLGSSDSTSSMQAALIGFLNVQLAPCVTRHGVFVEVYGEGILLVGDSGVGKSETAMELVKRGHRLIADDAVEIRRVSAKTLVGSAPDNIRHFIELRGIGIINVRRIFGIGAVKGTEKIDLVIQLENWDSSKAYDRLGLDTEYRSILGIDVPQVTIPVKPGRNLAIIIEVAAMNNRQKAMGYNAAQELMDQLDAAGEGGMPPLPSMRHEWTKQIDKT